ncbi:hypothetical protein HZB02_02220, partial [Candidatus Woesearchaeota archaeon]|nr:hypothetical protein [Candidatus Woesearchaeota archaeon]
CFLAEVSPFITILLLLQLVQMSFGAIRTPNISKNKNLSVSHLLTLPEIPGVIISVGLEYAAQYLRPEDIVKLVNTIQSDHTINPDAKRIGLERFQSSVEGVVAVSNTLSVQQRSLGHYLAETEHYLGVYGRNKYVARSRAYYGAVEASPFLAKTLDDFIDRQGHIMRSWTR